MRFPLHFSFKIAAITSQIYATDADGNNIFYVKQKLLKLKENIEIFSDSSKQTRLYTIKADRVIDFSPLFTLYDEAGAALGSVKRMGRASILKAHYEIELGGKKFTVREVNPWAKFFDALISEIPLLGLITGYILHPKYSITDSGEQVIGELAKLPAFFEGKYSLSSDIMGGQDEKMQKLFAVLMMAVVLRERLRG